MIPTFCWYFLSLKGRVSRQEFRLGFVGLLALSVVLARVFREFAFRGSSGRTWYRDEIDYALWLPLPMVITVVLWPLIAITAKRLHDLNVSGWWLLAILAVPFVSRMLHLNSVTVLMIAMAVLSSIPGATGANRFGEAPPLPRPAG